MSHRLPTRTVQKLALGTLVAWSAFSLPVDAQTSTDPVVATPPPTRTELTENSPRPAENLATENPKPDARTGRVLSEDAKPGITSSAVRPTVAERPELSPEVARKLQDFQTFREQYLKQRRELKDRFRKADEAERTRLRLRFQQMQEEWKRYSQNLLDQKREEELLKKLPDHRPLIEDARQKAREAARDSRPTRPGID